MCRWLPRALSTPLILCILFPCPQNVALKHSWVILLPGQQHSQGFRPYVHTKASRGSQSVMELDSVLTATLVYDLMAVALLSASTVTVHTMTGDRMLLL